MRWSAHWYIRGRCEARIRVDNASKGALYIAALAFSMKLSTGGPEGLAITGQAVHGPRRMNLFTPLSKDARTVCPSEILAYGTRWG